MKKIALIVSAVAFVSAATFAGDCASSCQDKAKAVTATRGKASSDCSAQVKTAKKSQKSVRKQIAIAKF